MNKSKEEEFNMTPDEVTRFTKALENPEFRSLLVDYAKEIQDPENRKRYEEEIAQMEAEKGVDVDFINPSPGYVVKTATCEGKKFFINICSNDKIDKPKCSKGSNPKTGEKGLSWSVPHSLSNPREDLDKAGVSCDVCDVVFHPDALLMAKSNARFRQLLTDIGADAMLKQFDIKINKNNLKIPKMKYKGTPQTTVIRTKKKNFENRQESVSPEEMTLAETLAFPTPYGDESSLEKAERMRKEVAERQVKKEGMRSNENITADSEGFSCPQYSIVHRSKTDLLDYRESSDCRPSTRPNELVVRISLPNVKSVSVLNLDIFESELKLETNKESKLKYRLHLSLPFPIVESESSAKFDKAKHQLTVCMPVVPDLNSQKMCHDVIHGATSDKVNEDDLHDVESESISDVKKNELEDSVSLISSVEEDNLTISHKNEEGSRTHTNKDIFITSIFEDDNNSISSHILTSKEDPSVSIYNSSEDFGSPTLTSDANCNQCVSVDRKNQSTEGEITDITCDSDSNDCKFVPKFITPVVNVVARYGAAGDKLCVAVVTAGIEKESIRISQLSDPGLGLSVLFCTLGSGGFRMFHKFYLKSSCGSNPFSVPHPCLTIVKEGLNLTWSRSDLIHPFSRVTNFSVLDADRGIYWDYTLTLANGWNTTACTQRLRSDSSSGTEPIDGMEESASLKFGQLRGILKHRSFSESSPDNEDNLTDFCGSSEYAGENETDEGENVDRFGRRDRMQRSVSFCEHVDFAHYKTKEAVTLLHKKLKNKRKKERRRERTSSVDGIDIMGRRRRISSGGSSSDDLYVKSQLEPRPHPITVARRSSSDWELEPPFGRMSEPEEEENLENKNDKEVAVNDVNLSMSVCSLDSSLGSVDAGSRLEAPAIENIKRSALDNLDSDDEDAFHKIEGGDSQRKVLCEDSGFSEPAIFENGLPVENFKCASAVPLSSTIMFSLDDD